MTPLRTSNENGAMITLIITCSQGESVRREPEGGGGRFEDFVSQSQVTISHTKSSALEANSGEFRGISPLTPRKTLLN